MPTFGKPSHPPRRIHVWQSQALGPAVLVVVGVGAVALIGAGSAGAATLINGRNITPHTITGKQVKHHSLFKVDLTQNAINSLHGAKGATGAQGATGARGPAGAAATFSALPCGVTGRNTIGSPVAQYRVGPDGVPLGIGSLGFEVAGPPSGGTTTDAEKISFGASGSDFTSETGVVHPPDITALTYKAYDDFDTVGASPIGLTIESDPDINTAPTGGTWINFTSLVYNPPATAAGDEDVWKTNDAMTGATWDATGAAGTATGCTLSTPCTFTQLMSQLGLNASIITFALSKGRDNAYNGAVDNLMVNTKTFDFEPLGVTVK